MITIETLFWLILFGVSLPWLLKVSPHKTNDTQQ